MLCFAAVPGRADEGMWLINALDAALEKKMQERGLLLNAKDIYDADAPGATLSDAVIALGFYCTGSMVSEEGLLITNHHCAFGDIHALSTPEHNYLEEGFWAMTRAEEKPVPGKQVFFLKKV
ncbi:MAG: S46 family peptidase, partial [Bacteroidales bacterium]|nr:S46 family peptidase [Bacteroidales bacterium]